MNIETIIRDIESGQLVRAKEAVSEVMLDKVSKKLDDKRTVTGETLATRRSVDEESDVKYERVFRSALKKFDITEPNDFDTIEEKKEFFDFIDDQLSGNVELSETAEKIASKLFGADARDQEYEDKPSAFIKKIAKMLGASPNGTNHQLAMRITSKLDKADDATIAKIMKLVF